MAPAHLWGYYRDEIDDVDDNPSDGKSVNYKTKIVGKTAQWSEWPPELPQNPDGTQPPRRPKQAVPSLNAEVTIPIKYLSKFWSFLDLPLIHFKKELDLSWKKNCVFSEHHKSIAGAIFK